MIGWAPSDLAHERNRFAVRGAPWGTVVTTELPCGS